MIHYLYWQFIIGPWWFINLIVNVQRLWLRYFSVELLTITLLAPWRRDSSGYNDRSLTGILKTFSLNQISRVIGFIIRTITLTIWFIIAVITFVILLIAMLLFLLWPVATAIALISGYESLYI